MPELPEIETIVNELKQKAVGMALSNVIIRNSDVTSSKHFSSKRLISRTIVAAERVGKFFNLNLSGDLKLWFHLGMTGQVLWVKSSETFNRHDHMILEFQGSNEQLRYRDIRRFGEIFMTMGNQMTPSLDRLGPDALQISCEDFVRRIKQRTGPIKNLLLNQQIVSGLGNIYVNESLFRAGIHPRRRPRRIPSERIGKLHVRMQEVLREAIQFGGSSIDDYRHSDGSKGSFQDHHQVYGRQGQSCVSCQGPIRRIQLAGRSSFYCPKCQK